MKLFFTSMMIFVACGYSFGQSPLPVGKAQLNFGIGLSGRGIPLYAGIDYSVQKDITIGAEISTRSYRENWKNDYYHHNLTVFLINGNYHFNTILKIPRNFDFYAGLNLGFYHWTSPAGYPGDYNSGVGLGAQIGGRYYFNNKVGINLEFGNGNAVSEGKFGLSIKL